MNRIASRPSLNGTSSGSPGTGVIVLFLFAAVFFGLATAVVGGIISGLLLFAIIASCVALANYRIGVWVLLLLLPLSATSIFPHQMLGITGANPYNALFGLTLISFLAERVLRHRSRHGKEKRHIVYPKFWWAYVTPIVVAALIGTQHIHEIPSFAYTGELVHFTGAGGYLRDALIKPFTYIFLALLLGAAMKDGMKPNTAISAVCMSIWLLAVWVIAYVLLSGFSIGELSGSSARGLLTRTGMHANGLGALAAFSLTLMVFALATQTVNPGMRLIYILTALASAMLLVVSFSRGGFVTFAVGLTIFFILQRRMKIIVIGIFAVAFVLPLLPAEYYERLGTGLGTGGTMVMHSSNDPLTAGRVAGVWIPLLAEARQHPLFGNGLLSVAWSMPFRNGSLVIETLNPHNMYLKMLLEVGIIGMVLMFLFFADLWRRFRKAAADSATAPQLAPLFEGAAAALVGHATFAMTGGDYLPNPSSALLWVFFGLLISVPAGCAVVERKSRLKTQPPAAPRHQTRAP